MPVDSEQVVSDILAEAAGSDYVGILAAGDIISGFASSYGQRSWFQTRNFNLDWSLVHSADKAVKCSYAGQQWSADTFAEKMRVARETVEVLKRPSITLSPDNYRVFLTPAAVEELLSLASWGGFSERAHQAKVTPLIKLVAGEEQLAEGFNLRQNSALGAAPTFKKTVSCAPTKCP